ncbi:MAG TPA: M1 family aminopeptidase, partial [Candidatus Polarisedimenticolia bacterium]
NCGEWRSPVPVQFPSFIFGNFKTTEGSYTRQAPASGEVRLRLNAVEGGMVAIAGKKENILFNVQQGLKNYEASFGPFPYGDLDISEMAHNLGFAQSPPGILFLSNVLEGGGGGGYVDQIIFHELAHQWWGNQVGWASSEDDWVSESWAEYSAGLMTEGIDPKRFREKLASWKRGAMEADPKGTIAAAYRSPERYRLLYFKGPYVVHMLRSWMGWDKFIKLTSTIQAKYKGKNINTDTLAREASTLMGYDMFPFFDQWVRDQGIPKVRYSWSSAKQDDGKFLVTIKLRQEDAPNFKYMMVPISFEFGKGDPVVVTKPILKADTDIEVKVPIRPTNVRLDNDATQLADFIQDKS